MLLLLNNRIYISGKIVEGEAIPLKARTIQGENAYYVMFSKSAGLDQIIKRIDVNGLQDYHSASTEIKGDRIKPWGVEDRFATSNVEYMQNCVFVVPKVQATMENLEVFALFTQDNERGYRLIRLKNGDTSETAVHDGVCRGYLTSWLLESGQEDISKIPHSVVVELSKALAATHHHSSEISQYLEIQQDSEDPSQVRLQHYTITEISEKDHGKNRKRKAKDGAAA